MEMDTWIRRDAPCCLDQDTLFRGHSFGVIVVLKRNA